MVFDIFIEISIIIVIATVIAFLMKLLKQPLIIGYIITGILLSSYFFDLVRSTDTVNIFSQIGVAFLLFIVGLNLSPNVIKEVGKVSIVTGLGQVIFTSLIGFFISRFLGFSIIESLYISIALTFSSTIIIMKLLSDKKDLETLYGKISIGFLIVQDIIAIFILLIVSSFSNKQEFSNAITETIGNGLLLAGIFLLLVYLLPKFGNFFAKSQELLFLFSIGLVLGLASLSHYFGFSIEIGALIAGVALSMTPYYHEISSKMKPLRDFFIILFFIFLGSQIFFTDITHYIVPAIVFSLFILIGNPLIVIILMGLLGYQKKVSFMAGLTVAQISEFSLILIALGVKLGHLSQEILSLVTIVGLITITASSYFIIYSNKIYPYFAGYLTIFERKKIKKFKENSSINYDIILLGYNRIGFDLLHTFKKLKKRFLIIDYNPEVIERLTSEKINCKYGDADDNEFLDDLKLNKVKMVISTIPDFETNSLLISKVKRIKKKIITIVVSHDIQEAKELYKNGATYVIMSHFLGGSYTSLLVNKYRFNFNKFLNEKKKHLEQLKKREEMGHPHPKIEKNP